MKNPVLDSRSYTRIVGALLLAVAAVGSLLMFSNEGHGIDRVLAFDWPHTALHAALGALALFIGLWREGEFSQWYARIFGLVYLALGVAGYWSSARDALDESLGIRLEMGENLLHLLIGAWGIVAGFFGPKIEIERLTIPDLE